jgi:hypothetical protein
MGRLRAGYEIATRGAMIPNRVDFFDGLLLNDRFGWPSRRNRVCVPVHDLPNAVFGTHDHRDPQTDGGDGLMSANLGLAPLDPHNGGKLRSYVLHYVLNVNKRAISDLRCGVLNSRSNLLPSTYSRAKGLATVTSCRWEYSPTVDSGLPFRNPRVARSHCASNSSTLSSAVISATSPSVHQSVLGPTVRSTPLLPEPKLNLSTTLRSTCSRSRRARCPSCSCA